MTTWPASPFCCRTPMTALAMSSLAARTPSTWPPRRGERLVERGRGLSGLPALDGRLRRDRQLAVLLQGPEHVVGTLGEEHGVVVHVRAAVHHDHARLGRAALLQAGGERLALQRADALVVERHVVGGLATEVDPVVVDDLNPGRGRLLLDRDSGRRVDRVDDQHLDALADHALRDLLELRGVALRVLDVRLDP